MDDSELVEIGYLPLRRLTDSEVDAVISEILRGDIDKYAWIVAKYQRDLWKIAAFMLQDIATTDDIVQQAFVNAYTKLDRYQPGKNFGAWLKQIARNLVKEEIRKRIRESNRMRVYYEHLLSSFEKQEVEHHRKELAASLKKCKEELPDNAAEALEMRYTYALSFQEIATKMDRTIAAIRQLLSRTRIALRDCIERRTSV